ncbi:MAG: hypothetical protein J3R72DRAFT_464906, partial [Linnemannia gamsii]
MSLTTRLADSSYCGMQEISPWVFLELQACANWISMEYWTVQESCAMLRSRSVPRLLVERNRYTRVAKASPQASEEASFLVESYSGTPLCARLKNTFRMVGCRISIAWSLRRPALETPSSSGVFVNCLGRSRSIHSGRSPPVSMPPTFLPSFIGTILSATQIRSSTAGSCRSHAKLLHLQTPPLRAMHNCYSKV